MHLRARKTGAVPECASTKEDACRQPVCGGSLSIVTSVGMSPSQELAGWMKYCATKASRTVPFVLSIVIHHLAFRV